MRPLPRDVRGLGRLLLPAEAAEVILGDLQEEADARFGAARPVRRAVWLRWETLRCLAAYFYRRTGAGSPSTWDHRTATATTGTTRRTTTMGFATRVRAAGEELRSAVRSLLRSPTFTLFAAGTLALGVGSAATVYSTVERVILNPLPYPDAERMAVLWLTTDGDVIAAADTRHVRAWRELDVFEDVQHYRAGEATLTGRGDPVDLRVKAASEGYFDFLGVRPLLGRGFSPGEHSGEGARVAVLSHEFWIRRLGGDEDVLGTALTLDEEPWTVVGVLPPRVYPPNSGPGFTDLWTPLGRAAEGGGVFPVARLRPGVTLERVDRRLGELAERAPAEGLGPAAEWRARAFDAASFGRGRVADTLRTLFAAVVLLLLVSAANVSNLVFQRAWIRERDTAVREALGASRGRLVRQVLLESLVIAALAASVGLALARGALALVTAARPREIAWLLDGVRIEPRVLAFGVLASVAAGLAAGVLPALRIFRGSGRSGQLRSRRHAGGEPARGRGRWSLVAAEVALSFALLTGTVMVVGTLAEMRTRDPGFRTEGLLAVEVSLPEWRYGTAADRRAAFEEMASRLGRLPAVRGVALTDATPPGLPGIMARLHPEGRRPADRSSYVRNVEAGAGFLGVLGQPLLAGRDLRAGDGGAADRPVVVSRFLAERLFPDLTVAEAVGRRFSLEADGDALTIVGVAEDVRVNGLAYEAGAPVVYRPLSAWSLRETVAVRLEAGADPGEWARRVGLRGSVLAVAPEAVVDVRPAGSAMAESLVQERFTTLMMAGFALLALALAGVGLYGVLSRSVAGRTREIGIRMSLGADRDAVRRLVLRPGAAATLAGLAGGAVVALAGLRLLSAGLFGLEPGRPEAFLVAATVLGTVALAAVWVPVRRATRMDPSIAMREE